MVVHTRQRRWLLAVALVAAAAGTLPACRSNSSETDRLRGENIRLKTKVAELNQTLELRAAEIRILEDRDPTRRSKVEGAQMPRTVGVSFGRFSGFYDSNGDGNDDTLRVYLLPVDQQGRFLPAAGRAVLQAVAIQPGQAPRVIIEKVFAPPEFSEAYRAGITGTHFTLEAALPADLPEDMKDATVKVTFTDAGTGGELAHEHPMSIRRARARGAATRP